MFVGIMEKSDFSFHSGNIGVVTKFCRISISSHLRFENVMATQLDNTGAFTETLINVHCSKNEMK